MRIDKKKLFIACDTTKISKVKKIIKYSKTRELKIGFKFGLEFLNSIDGRKFIKSLKNKIIFIDIKLNDIPNTMKNAVVALSDLKPNYLTVHISSGVEALKAVKSVPNKIYSFIKRYHKSCHSFISKSKFIINHLIKQ